MFYTAPLLSPEAGCPLRVVLGWQRDILHTLELLRTGTRRTGQGVERTTL